GHTTKPGVLLPFSDNAQRPAEPVAGFNSQVRSLVINELPHKEVVVVNAARQVTGADVHGRMNHGGVAPIMLSDSGRYISRVCDEVVHAIRRGSVPHPQVVRGEGKNSAGQLPHAAAVSVAVVEIPQIAHRRMAITDMTGVGAGQNALGGPGFGTEYQVV